LTKATYAVATSDRQRRDRPLAIDAQKVERRFGGSLALKGVSVQARQGTIHALVGENGAGKSTFLGIIAGRISPTSGRISIFGEAYRFGDPRHARQLGIAAIYQELTIVPALSTQANVFLGQTPSRYGLVAELEMRSKFRELCTRLGVAIPADVRAGRLSVADQQMLEIMRGLQSDARLLLFDEPTTSLAPPERESLFRIMSELREHGRTMMFVSHNLREVLDIADVVTVFRDGEVAATAPRSDWTKRDLVRAMIGQELRETTASRITAASRAQAHILLSARSISLPNAAEEIDLDLAAGEIVGIGGLVGSGRSSLLRSLAGLEPRSQGRLWLEGVPVQWPRTPKQALRLGIALVPEDRKAQGLVLGMSAMSNITMADYGRVSRFGVLSKRAMNEQSRAVASEFGFATTRVGTLVRNLSGGNQQKVLLSKWRHHQPKILLVDEPTRGIDIRAKQEILETLRRLADFGLGIVMVSSELEEVAEISDRVLVLSEGRSVAELDRESGPLRVEDILNAAFKVTRE
jgi:ABC-type sugar transport system ATPase subunit